MAQGKNSFEEVLHPLVGLLANSALWADGGVNYQHRFVKLAAGFKVNLAATNELPIGVLMNKPAGAGQAATVAGAGSVVKILVGTGGVTAGDKLTPDSDSSGRAVTAAAGDYVGAIALETGSETDLIAAYLIGGVDAI